MLPVTTNPLFALTRPEKVDTPDTFKALPIPTSLENVETPVTFKSPVASMDPVTSIPALSTLNFSAEPVSPST